MRRAFLCLLLVACSGKPADAPPPATATPALSDPPGTATPPVAATSDTTSSDPASTPGTVSTGSTGNDDSDAPDKCATVAAPFEEKVRPLFNKCYQEGKKKNPELAGVAKIAISVNTLGKVTAVKSAGTSELGDAVMACIVKAIKAEPFDGSLCKARTVTVSKQYGDKKK